MAGQGEVAQAHVFEQLQRVRNAGHAGENSTASIHLHLQHISPMLLPRQVTARVSGLKRAPWQVSQGTFTSGRSSSRWCARPAFAAGQRPFAGVEAEPRRVAARLASSVFRQTACGWCPRSRCRWRAAARGFADGGLIHFEHAVNGSKPASPCSPQRWPGPGLRPSHRARPWYCAG